MPFVLTTLMPSEESPVVVILPVEVDDDVPRDHRR